MSRFFVDASSSPPNCEDRLYHLRLLSYTLHMVTAKLIIIDSINYFRAEQNFELRFFNSKVCTRFSVPLGQKDSVPLFNQNQSCYLLAVSGSEMSRYSKSQL